MKSPNTSPRCRRSGRSRARGAAMVEAAVVLPVLVAFLGVGMMMHRAYADKIEQNQGIRAGALDFAAHDCENRSFQRGAKVTRGEADVARGTAERGPKEVAGAIASQKEKGPTLSGRSGRAVAEYGDHSIDNPKPSEATRGHGLRITVHGEKSETLCNDSPRGGTVDESVVKKTSDDSVGHPVNAENAESRRLTEQAKD